MTRESRNKKLILLTGATGYVGGRLLRALEHQGHRLRCLARRPEFLKPTVSAATEIVAGDVLDPTSLGSALRGVSVAYYLVHSMGSAGSFEENDRQSARNFAAAAKAEGVELIIYLGALGNDGETLSPHLRSRQEVGDILRGSGVPVVEFRASIVIGSGSLSFEMIRSLVERLPIIITPKWVSSAAQPIAIDDLLAYLTNALLLPVNENRIFEIGGADQVSYAGIMRAYARQRGMRILMIPVPVLTPFLSSLWLGLVTPLYARIGRKLIESIVHSTVVRDKSALETFDIRPLGVDEAVRKALTREDEQFAATRGAMLRRIVGAHCTNQISNLTPRPRESKSTFFKLTRHKLSHASPRLILTFLDNGDQPSGTGLGPHFDICFSQSLSNRIVPNA